MATSDTDWRVEKKFKTTNPTVVDDFVAAQNQRLLNSRQRIGETEQRNYQQFKESQSGQVIRDTFASGSRKLRRISDNSSNKIVRKGARYAAAKLKVSTINMWVGSWATFWYLSFQLPFALVSIAGLGMGAIVYQTVASVIGETATNLVLKTLYATGASTAELIKSASELAFGFSFDPIILFIAPFALIFMLGVFQLVLVWTIYNLAGIKSLSGERSGVKNTMFLIAGIGMVIPVLNLFPLIFLWMMVVWKYPK